jgi:hypothetical protein
MSSKRGRKRNDNLPPNRARDVQRAFRARRAAHLDVRIISLSLSLSLRTLYIPSRVIYQLHLYSHIFKTGPRTARLRARGGKR